MSACTYTLEELNHEIFLSFRAVESELVVQVISGVHSRTLLLHGHDMGRDMEETPFDFKYIGKTPGRSFTGRGEDCAKLTAPAVYVSRSRAYSALEHQQLGCTVDNDARGPICPSVRLRLRSLTQDGGRVSVQWTKRHVRIVETRPGPSVHGSSQRAGLEAHIESSEVFQERA